MADDLDTGAAPAASETAHSIPVEIQNSALESLAMPENIEGYVAERTDQQKESRGEPIDAEERGDRIRKALIEAREQTEKARQTNGLDQPPNLDTAFEDAERVWQQQQAEEQRYQQELEATRNTAVGEGKFMQVAQQLKASNPAVYDQITGVMAAIDATVTEEQSQAVVRGLTKGSGTEGMAIAHRLSQPSYDENGNLIMSAEQKIRYLASLPPQQIESILDQSRDYLKLEHDISRRYAAKFAAQGRRHTAAPPPIRAPRGSANPPRSIHQLALKDDVGSYVKARQAMEKRRDE
jgi:hypothetical protein